jgi:cell division protein FtsI/penicillin-binding protein 2
MIDIVQKTGKNIFYKYIMDFGFGTKSNINMDGEVYSKIDAPDKWSRTKLFTMSFGQGISVTMLQMAAAYSAIANGGIYMEPHIISSITYPDGRTYDTPPNPLRRVIKEETSKKVIAMLVDGVRRGFAAKG